MKKSIRGWAVLVCAGIVMYITAIYFIIPKAAALSLPFRWGSVPLGQKRPLVLQYFGRPAYSTAQTLTDKWVARRGNGEYVLTIHYTEDSVADSYKLYFNYRLYFLSNKYLLRQK